jgi:phage terminase small subunit
MSKPLTQKQEAFALAYVETGNASEAYRRAYDAQNMQPESIWVEACRTLGDPNVGLRVSELQAAAAERTLVTIETITKELMEDREFARLNGQAAAAISATMGKAKVNGLITDKVAGDKDNPIQHVHKIERQIIRANTSDTNG